MKNLAPHLFTFIFITCAGAAVALAEETPAASSDGKKSAIPETWFPHVDGTFTKGEFIDLNSKTGERLFIRYGPISDSGVELDLVTGEGKLVWRAQVKPLGVSHSKYRHEVWIRIEDGRIQVTSVGARTIIELIELASGKSLSRSVHETKR